MSLVPGGALGPYNIIESIGRGGMGEVYRARDSRLRRDVAIKTSAESFDQRFEREARAIAALNHPNICQIYDVGPDYLVMELVEGPTLQEVLARGALSVDAALRISDQIADALAAAHEQSITHRDLKPSNIKVKEDGVVKVLDFGLAKIGPSSATPTSDSSPTMSLTFTQAGMILGTAAYMSPEQARGKPVDARADIWAFGVVLYEMVTGRRPFTGDDVAETLASVVKEAPDLSAVPLKVRRLVEACLQKNPKHRLQAIGDRLLLLDQAEPGREPRRVSGMWPVLTGAVTLMAAAVAWMHFTESTPTTPTLRYQLSRPGETGFAHFQISADGRYLAYQAGPTNRLYVRALDSLEERAFPDTDGTSYPFWSPDGTHIAFFAEGALKQVALSGGPATFIAKAPDPRGGAWGRDGTIVFAPAVIGTLSRVSAAGGPATPMDLPREGAGPRDSLRFPAFLPNSDRFFYTIEADKREGEGVYVGSLTGEPPVRILQDFSTTRFVLSPGSSSKGLILFRRNTTLMAQPFDAAALQVEGEAFPLAEAVPDSGNTSNTAFTVSSNGILIYQTGAGVPQDRELIWLDRRGKHGTSLLRQPDLSYFALSPDRTQLAYSWSTQRAPGDLWLRDVARGVSQRLTFGPFSAFGPVWSADGTVVFTEYPEDALYSKATTTTSKEEALGVSGTNTYATSWSGAGRFMVFTRNGPTTKSDLWLLPMDGDRKARIFKQTAFAEADGQISPDGRWMAYTSDASGRFEVYIESIAGGDAARQISVTGGSAPRWRPDGRELYFISDRRMMAVAITPGPAVTFGTSQELFHEPNLVPLDGGFAYEPSADGRFLVALRVGGVPEAPPLTVVTNWRSAYGK
jgi:eukaryotic-like serine/threonine-protein kinase